MTRLVWADSALSDLDDITEYLDGEAVGVGRRLLAVVDRRTALLAAFPYLGEFIPELGLRKLTRTGFRYLLLYEVAEAAITIVRRHHAAQNWRPR